MVLNLISKISASIKKRRLNSLLNVKFGKNVILCGDNKFEGQNLINDNVALTNCEIGKGTYISGGSNLRLVKIGKFCSIGQNVTNGIGIHPSSTFVSTHPSFFSLRKQAGFTFVNQQKFNEHKFVDQECRYYIEIGSDVWIGNNVIIFDGIKIGDGAIIGAGAIVTKDVSPYTVVGGVPAKMIKQRFQKDDIEFLLNLKWWEKDLKWIKKHSKFFTDIKLLKEALKSE